MKTGKLCASFAGVEVVRVGRVFSRQSECCATEGAEYDQTNCILAVRHCFLLDDSSSLGQLFNECFLRTE